jgi:hypothetical protein
MGVWMSNERVIASDGKGSGAISQVRLTALNGATPTGAPGSCVRRVSRGVDEQVPDGKTHQTLDTLSTSVASPGGGPA